MVQRHAPERIVSLLDPDMASPVVRLPSPDWHLRLSFHDAHFPEEGVVLPALPHIRRLLKFLKSWKQTAPILIHCRAGIGRSTGAAFVACCLFNRGVSERQIAEMLRRVAPLARPNEKLVSLADDLMGRDGRMTAAIRETGRDLSWVDVDEGEPFALSSVL